MDNKKSSPFQKEKARVETLAGYGMEPKIGILAEKINY